MQTKNRPKLQAAVVETLETRTMLAWTPLVRTAPAGLGTMMLLTDGTVMAQRSGVTNVWYKLTPDSTGSYVNGTWSTLQPMGLQRLYFASNVLTDGRVFVLGGEYSGPSGTANWINSGEIYNPLTNTWSSTPNHPNVQYGDVPSALLPDGRVLTGSLQTASTYIYNPATNAFSNGPTKIANDRSDEETWVVMPDGSIMSYNIFGTSPQRAQRLDPATNTWIDSGLSPVQLHTTSGKELGPTLRLPDGRFLWIGATNKNAIYTPSTTPGGPGTWVAAPDTPGNIGANDAPGAILPNGHVIYAAGDPSTSFNPPTTLFEYDYTNNSLVPMNMTNGPTLSSTQPFTTRMLMLPSGEMLFAQLNSTRAYVYSEAGTIDDSWRSSVTNIVNNNNGTFTLTGTQLNGISEGATYGDDAQMSSNYPIIRLTSASGVVTFARTFNWSNTAVATGSTPVTTQVTLPAGITGGAYKLAVIANGIASKEVLAVFLGGTLGSSATLKLDPGNPSNVAVFQIDSPIASFPLTSVNAAYIVGDNTSNAPEVDDDLSGLPVFVNGGSGADSLRVRANLTTGTTWNVDATHVTSAGRLDVTYAADVEALALALDDDTDTINVTETSPTTTVTLEPSAGDDAVNVNTDNTGSANLLFGGTQRIGALTIGAGGRADLASAGSKQVLSVTSVAIAADAVLDLHNNDLIVDYTGSSPIAAVQGLINSARNGGAWTGAGISSTDARVASPANTTLGMMESTDYQSIYGPSATFDGQTIDQSALLIRYTYYGDTDFNGTVNFDDYSRTDAGFNTGASGWLNGDFDGNGVVNFDDYSLIDLAFNTQGGPLRPSTLPTRGGTKPTGSKRGGASTR